MIRNLILTLSLVLCALISLQAQQEVFDCPDAELAALCDLEDVNGYTFTNPDPSMSNPPGGALCGGGVFNNPGWFSFVAGSESIEVTVAPVLDPVTNLPQCDTIMPGGQTGIQVALWEDCPETNGTCVAGDANCNDQPITLSASGLTIGEIYNLVIDGCAGSVCTVTVTVDQSQPFEIPAVDDVDLNEPEYNIRGGCDSALPDGNFCAGLEILFSVDDETYESLGAEFTWTIDAVSGAADPSTVDWSSGSFTGTGSPALVGDLMGELGASVISMSFMEPGVYEVCLIDVNSSCDDSQGETCIEVTIITPGDQDFGEYDVCVLDLLAGWEVPDEDPNGNPWGAGDIFLDDVLSAPDGIIEQMISDDCGCEFTQRVDINPVGSLDREDVYLQLLPCQLPYEWFDVFIDEPEDYINGREETLENGSAQMDYDGDRCDSLVTLFVIPLEIVDSIIIGDCTPAGTEFTFIFSAVDADGNDIDFTNVTYEWIDSSTNMVVSMDETALLESGTYYVRIISTIEDLNYSDLAGNEPDDQCEGLFGPFELTGGSSQEPDIMPYDSTLCQDQLNDLFFVIDTVPNTTYTWMVPPNIPNTVSPNGDSLNFDWSGAMMGDTIFVSATNDCGESDPVALPLTVVAATPPDVIADLEDCITDEFMVEYDGDQSQIALFTWDFGSGMVTSGNPATGGPLGVSFPNEGSYTYFLTVEFLDGCSSMNMFDVTIEDPVEAPTISCMGDPSTIVFSWNDTGADSYSVNEINVPGGATGIMTGTTEYTITGLNPNEQAEIEVVANSSNACGNVTVTQMCAASSCNLAGVNTLSFSDMEFCQNHPDNQIVDFEHELPMGITGVYSGNGIVDAVEGLFDPNDPSVVLGDNVITFTFMDANCTDSETVTVTVFEIPSVDFTPSSNSVCENEVFTLNGFNMDPNAVWDYGTNFNGDFTGISYNTAGTYDISLVVVDPISMCGDSMTVQVEVRENIDQPILTCAQGIDFVNFDWNDIAGITDYDVEVLVNGGSVFNGNQANSDYSQIGLNQGDQVDITVTVVADNGCGMFTETLTCNAQTCITPVLSVSAAVTTFCNNETLGPVFIDAMADGAVATGTWAGPGITDPNMNIFDPSIAGVGVHTVAFNYTHPVDNCLWTETIDFEVVDVPVPSFTLDRTEICIDEVASITSEMLPPNVNEVWMYNTTDVNVISPTQVEVGYDQAGDFNVVLEYMVAGCPANEAVQTITVVDTITAPPVRCEAVGTDFIEFAWDDQANVDEYEVYIDGMLIGTQAGLSYMLTGLNPQEQHEITLIAIDNECGSRTSTLICETPSCYIPTIELSAPVNSFCTNESLSTVIIDVLVDNVVETGTFSGPGIEDENLNLFDPALAGPGMHTVTFSYLGTDGCTTLETIEFEVLEVPMPSFNLDRTEICIDKVATITSQALPPNVNEVWTYNTIDVVVNSPTEIEVGYDAPGDYNITLGYSITGCPANETVQTITVVDTISTPDLTCANSGTDFIDINWTDQTNADGYEIYVDGVLVGMQSNVNYMLTGLDAETQYEITLVALDNECGSRTITMFCETPACVLPTLENNIPAMQCYEPGSGAILLDVDVMSNAGLQGTYTWDTPMVDANNMFTPNAGDQTYNFNVIYTEENCTTMLPVSFDINEIPENTLDLSVDNQVICVTSSIQVTGEAPGLTDEFAAWDFGDNTIVDAQGVGFGPYDLTFSQAGSYDVSLIVENAGCFSEEQMVTIVVEDELVPPTLNCDNQGVFSLDFSWDAVDCADDYVVFVDGSQVVTVQSTSYTLDNLNELQSVDIQIEAVSACACQNVMSAVLACSTTACPATTFTESSFETEVCLDVTAAPFMVSASPDDLQGNGTGVWSGTPISNPNGTVDPSLVGPGTYQLVYDYEEGGCTYSYSTEVSFVEAPDLNILEELDPTCVDDPFGSVSVEGFGGMAGYMYSIDGGAQQSTGNFSAVSPGTHVIEVEDANGCINSTTLSIANPPSVNASIQGPVTVILDSDATYTVDTNAPNISNIIWTADGTVVCEGPNCTSYTIFFAQADTYLEVQVVFNDGCVVTADFNVDVKEIHTFYIPNIISNTTQDQNSELKIFMKGSETFVRSVNIYNRWGNLVHTAVNAETQMIPEWVLWDGNIGDSQAVTEVYVYIVDMEIEGIPRSVTGSVTIIR